VLALPFSLSNEITRWYSSRFNTCSKKTQFILNYGCTYSLLYYNFVHLHLPSSWSLLHLLVQMVRYQSFWSRCIMYQPRGFTFWLTVWGKKKTMIHSLGIWLFIPSLSIWYFWIIGKDVSVTSSCICFNKGMPLVDTIPIDNHHFL
jgi:hypothetical protein